MTKIIVAEDEPGIRAIYETALSGIYSGEDLKLVATAEQAISEL